LHQRGGIGSVLSHRLTSTRIPEVYKVPADGLGQSLSIPHAAAASTARCHASAGVAPSTRSLFSPFDVVHHKI
jgi:hypothetical protein